MNHNPDAVFVGWCIGQYKLFAYVICVTAVSDITEYVCLHHASREIHGQFPKARLMHVGINKLVN